MTGTTPPAASAYPTSAQRPPRPPLAHATKVGAAIAGAVSFAVLNIGFVLFWLPILAGFIAVIFTTIARLGTRIDQGADADFRRFAQVVDSLELEAWALPLVLVSVVGLAIMVVAVFTSKRMLTARRIARPWPITWAGLGVAVVANSIVGGVLSTGGNLAASFSGQREYGGGEAALITVLILISVVVSIAVNAAVGGLSMWWMAHVFRPAVPVEASTDQQPRSALPATGD